jgi:4-carboxymuconolactone decarboxylase
VKTEARLPYLKPEELDDEQRELYDFHLEAMKAMPYVWLTEDGELTGPSNALIHTPEIGKLFFPANRAIMRNSIETVGGRIHEIVALVMVGDAKAQYGIYGNTVLAQEFGLSDQKIAGILAGQRPANLTTEEEVAYDLASCLRDPGPVPDMVYGRAVEAFGEKGYAALVYVAGMYKMVGTILNAYDEPVPSH